MPHFTNLRIMPPVLAHRGANRFAPENTLAAFLIAKKLGFHWVELDVMLSADNELVVIHDEELARTTNGTGAVIDYPYDFLKQLDAGSWFSPTFSMERISTLRNVLAFLYENQLSVNIEIKALQHRDELVVQKFLEVFNDQAVQYVSPPLVSSFSMPVLQLVRKQSPDCLLGFLMDDWQTDWEKQCDLLQCIAVNVNQALLTQERAAAIKASGRQLLAYTVNEQARAKQLYSWGVDAIFSDCSQEIVDMVQRAYPEGYSSLRK